MTNQATAQNPTDSIWLPVRITALEAQLAHERRETAAALKLYATATTERDTARAQLEAACQACTHLHEKLEAAEADWRVSAERYDREVVQLRSELLLAAADRDAFDEKLKEAEAEAAKWRDDAERLLQAKDALEAQRDRLESLLRKPGCWSEWARECLAVLSREGRAR